MGVCLRGRGRGRGRRRWLCHPFATQACNLAEGFEGDAVGGGEDEDLMGAEADGVDGFGVDEVDVIAGGEDGAT